MPWFVADVDGEPDFRIVRPGGTAIAWSQGRCWVCGGSLGKFKTFLIGPMCAINRVSAEPPSHRECADWSARACPFLSRPHAKRRDHDKPEGTVEPAGVMLARNPGVALAWTTRNPRKRRVPNGVLFNIGDPTDVRWYAHGRAATREEVLESIESGYPTLRELAAQDGPAAIPMLEAMRERVMAYVPA